MTRPKPVPRSPADPAPRKPRPKPVRFTDWASI